MNRLGRFESITPEPGATAWQSRIQTQVQILGSGPLCSVAPPRDPCQGFSFLTSCTNIQHPPGAIKGWSTHLASVLQTLEFSAPWEGPLNNHLSPSGATLSFLCKEKEAQVLETDWDPLIWSHRLTFRVIICQGQVQEEKGKSEELAN